MRNLAVEVNYVWRKYDQFTWTDRNNWDSTNFQAFTLGRRRTAVRRRTCESGDLLRADVGAAVAVHPHATSRTGTATTTASSSR